MSHRFWIASFLGVLLAAGGVQAAPPTPEARERLGSSGDLSIFEPEPFSVTAPRELLASVAERISAGETVHLNMVVILAEFSDNRAKPTSTIAHFDSLLFSRDIYPTGSMADYFHENSGGRLVLSGQVRGWYLMPRQYAVYVSNQAGRGSYPYNVQGFVEDAIAAAEPDINYALYDNNGPDGVADTIDDDKIVDLLLVVHAGAGGESAGSRFNLQSLAWHLPNLYPVDGVYAQEFAVAPEEGALGVFAHETGHLLGLPDLYDATGGSFGLGTWSLMAGGWSLDEARTPAHLDAWCKAELGFVSPVPVFSTMDHVVMDPVEAGGKVYSLARDGLPGQLEYFLVENRQRIGFDQYLPGAGLLIYHVNELAPTNNIPTRYLVGLEQADGLFQLENFYQNPSFGDPGDPWTADAPSGGFGRFSVPDSRSSDGSETGVTVYRISGPDASLRMTASFRSLKGPTIRLERLDAVASGGDGDSFVEPGESFDIAANVVVQGGTAHDIVFKVTSTDPLAQPGPSVTVPSLATGTHRLLFPAGVAGGVPSDPYGLDFAIELNYREEVPIRSPMQVAVGAVEGFATDLESGFQGFIHYPSRPAYMDYWRPEPAGGSAGPHVWRAGRPEGGLPKRTDSALETPLFILPAGALLKFDHLVDIPRSDSSKIVAGAFVELSVNGGSWTQITPSRGYDYRFFSNNRDLNGRWIFTTAALQPAPPEWESLTFDLSPYQGGAVVRFRLFSTDVTSKGTGWWIDNIRVESADTPVRLAAFSAARTEEGVALAWRLSGEDDLSGIAVSRKAEGEESFRRLNDALLPATTSGTFVDTHAPENQALLYRLAAVRRDGTPVELGQVTAPGAGTSPVLRLAAHPNPARGPVVFEFNAPAASPVRLTLFDASGRPVRRLVDGLIEPGEHRISWDGLDGGGVPVPAGVYFYRLERGAAADTRKLVIAR